MAPKKQWWQTTFDEKYLKTYIDTAPPELTRKQIDFVIKKIKLRRGDKILDLACGYGRHSLELARQGLKVVGLDYSSPFIKIAKNEAKQKSLNVDFIRQDMRQMKFHNKFDAVINLFTSFGYFDDDQDNILVLKKISQSLKRGGRLLIDIGNLARMFNNMIDGGKFDKKTGLLSKAHQEKLSNGILTKTVNQFDSASLRWRFTRSWKEKGKLRSYSASVRYFSLPELKYLLAERGLKVEKAYGDYDGSSYGFKSRRMIILAKKV